MAASLLSVFLISLLSFSGVFFLALKKKSLERLLFFLVSFAAGGLLGGAFIHLIPEAVVQGCDRCTSLLVLAGILAFFVLEKFISWRHCHLPTSQKHPHPLALMNLVGDGVHNLTDGLVIGASFMVNFPLGLVTSLAVALHEIPQEIGDFGVLVYAGLSRLKALFLNFLSGLTALLGVFLVFVLGKQSQSFARAILPFTAGGFIYIAASDLLPELKKETRPGKSFWQLVALVLGMLVMLVLTKLK